MHRCPSRCTSHQETQKYVSRINLKTFLGQHAHTARTISAPSDSRAKIGPEVSHGWNRTSSQSVLHVAVISVHGFVIETGVLTFSSLAQGEIRANFKKAHIVVEPSAPMFKHKPRYGPPRVLMLPAKKMRGIRLLAFHDWPHGAWSSHLGTHPSRPVPTWAINSSMPLLAMYSPECLTC